MIWPKELDLRRVLVTPVVMRVVAAREVVVAFEAVKFWRVEEPVMRRSPPIFAKRELGSK
jgi:hypothetical protein